MYVGYTVPPSLEDIEEIAETVIDALPSGLHKHIGKLKAVVEDFPDAFIEQELELETPFDLLGCYQSPGPACSSGHMGGAGKKKQDAIYLYRRPILDAWADTGEDLTRLVNRVILQEIGHHFGFSQDDIDLYEEDMFGATAPVTGAG
ncbi:MAG: acetylglutamate kinase [Alphaproteobacteria bacterium]|nr:acetylglutamate kinase [Alphaproteobacteria bacterium]